MDDSPTKCPSDSCLPSAKAHLVFWLILIVGVTADLWSKSTVHRWLATLPDAEHVFIQGLLKFVIRLNPGAAWSIFENQTVPLLCISIIALAVVLGIFLFGRTRRITMAVAMGLFAAGITGNLYDRAFNNGLVRDFIDVVIPVINYPWPAFNIADSMLCIAIALLIISIFTSPSARKHAHPQK
jgi:signal peptidase II